MGAVRAGGVGAQKLDDVLAERGIQQVDFIKLAAEGGELAVLEGARRLRQSIPQPAILAEVEDIRTRHEGMHRAEMCSFLRSGTIGGLR